MCEIKIEDTNDGGWRSLRRKSEADDTAVCIANSWADGTDEDDIVDDMDEDDDAEGTGVGVGEDVDADGDEEAETVKEVTAEADNS